MDQDHEYSVLGGMNRAAIGRYLAIMAAAISSVVVFILLTAVDIAKSFGLPANVPPSIFSLIGAGTIFALLYWVFSRFIWRWAMFSRLLRVPNLAGKWSCDGQTLTPDGRPSFTWQGEVVISQNWDKIRVRLRTPQSGSNSITAALIWDDIDGYRLLYNYRNIPQIDQPGLQGHLGFAELVFAEDRLSAVGEYFNGHGRFTFGTMRLTRL